MRDFQRRSGPVGPDMVEVVYTLGIALRRVLPLIDKRQSAARDARAALALAEKMLRNQSPRRPS
jgi:hypothetical protein